MSETTELICKTYSQITKLIAATNNHLRKHGHNAEADKLWMAVVIVEHVGEELGMYENVSSAGEEGSAG